MILAIDMIGTNLGSGTKTYNYNFCDSLNKFNFKDTVYIFITKDYSKFISMDYNKNVKYIVKPNFLNYILLRIFWMQFILPFELKLLKVHQLFSPMNIGPVFLKLFNIKFSLALHSNLPWVYFSKMPGNFIRNLLTKFIMEISVKVCDKLIVDSEFAKNEIVQLLNLNKNKIYPVYLGVDKKYLSEGNDFFIKNFDYKDYFVSVLSCVRYHNIINLLKGFKLLKLEHNINLKFIIVLQILDKNYYEDIKKFVFKNFKNNEVIFLHDLESKYLVNLYKNAKFYIFSSYCEVFGLTSLEAMSQGCPVLVSNRSALPEINSNAADYFNPDDENEIKDVMNKILNDSVHREEILQKANKYFRKFDWNKTVNETMRVLFN